MTSAQLSFRLALVLCFGLLVPRSASADANCAACSYPTVQGNVMLAPNASVSPSNKPASTGMGKFIVALYPATFGGGMPNGLPVGTYQAWCATNPGDPAPGDTATFYADSTLLTGATLSQVNFILNNKRGTIADVQEALWAVLGRRSPTYLSNNGLTDAVWMYNQAVANSTYVPPPGGRTGLILKAPVGSSLVQNVLIELNYCATIGDRVWKDTVSNNYQDTNAISPLSFPGAYATPMFGYQLTNLLVATAYQFTDLLGTAEKGINGVNLSLYYYPEGGSSLTATPVLRYSNGQPYNVVTGPAPLNYPFLPYGSDGYYQFNDFCPLPGTYEVRLSASQTVVNLANLVPSGAVNPLPPIGMASNELDSNSSPAPAKTLVTTTGGTPQIVNPAVDESLDFGFSQAGLSISCPYDSVYAGVNFLINAPPDGTGAHVTGGSGVYTFSQTGLPTGFSLGKFTGLISGSSTVVTNGAITYTITVSDGTQQASKACQLTVMPKLLTGVSCPAATVMADGDFSATISPTGGTLPYHFAALETQLPSWLTTTTVVNTQGQIVGLTISGHAPTAFPPGYTQCGPNDPSLCYPYLLGVWDSSGSSAYSGVASCLLKVIPTTPTLSCPTGSALTGSTFGSQPLVGGGAQPYTFTYSSGNSTPLPSDFTFTSAGVVTFTAPAASSVTFQYSLKDGTGASYGPKSCTVPVLARPSANCVAITAVKDVAITPTTLTPTGGVGGPYTFSATGLPAGLTISSSGTISGTPSVTGKFDYTVTIQDAAGNTGTLNCSVTVNGLPTANCVTVNAVQGIAITDVKMVATGGSGAPYTFSATGLPAGLTMASDGTISGTPTVSGSFTYVVTVKDKDGNAGTVNCSTVTVKPPVSANCVTITAVQGVKIADVQMTGTGGNGAPYTFSATGLPAGLTMASDGTISGTPTVSGSFTYVVTVKDKDGNAGTVNCSTVTVNPPVSANCVTITAVQGIAIADVKMTGTGGNGGPYTFSATGLPAGLTMAADGTISGTPTVSGSFTYVVTVKDKDGNTGTVNCSTVTVNPPVSANCVTITAVHGIAIADVKMTATGGNGGPYTFSATGLPAGLAMAADGTISGTPTVSGSFTYVVTVKDKDGNAGTVNCSTVTVNPPVSANCVTITAVQGIAIADVKMTGTGGNGGPYTFSATGLPAGLTMAADGTISGTPTVSGSFTYVVTVKDKDGNAGTVNCSTVTVNPPVSANCVTISAVEGSAFSVTLTAAGGTGGYVFAKTSGPAWLNVSAAGVVSGTPTESGNFSYSVSITDKDGHVGTLTCNFTVIAKPSANCVTISAVEGSPFSVTLTAAGGTGGYVFAKTSGPAWLNVSAAGVVSGTPTESGNFSYSVSITDKDGHVGTLTCNFTVIAKPSANCVTISAVEGSPFSVTLTAAGGTGGYVFAKTSGPAWLNVSAAGVVSGTPTESGNFSYSVSITDKDGNTGTLTCNFTVIAKPSANCVTISAVEGSPFSVTLTATGGTGGYVFAKTDGPAWLSVSSTGVVSGTPTASGNFSYSVSITDKDGHVGTLTCSFTVISKPSANCVTISAVQGAPFSVTLTATGGTGGYVFAKTAGPAWLNVSSTGVVSGTPTESGNFSYSVSITDKDGNVGTLTCNFTVISKPSANCVTITAVEGAPFSVTLTATGGTGGYVFAKTAGPAWLNVSSTGVVSGTPTASGNFSYSVSITDKDGNTGTLTCSFSVNPKPSATCVTITAVLGMSITPVTLTGSGGAGGPYTFSATGLPAGLSMSADGKISGIPAVGGNFTYTVTVTDKNGNSGTISCSVSVSTPSNVCGLTWGYWKNHVSAWPAQTLVMGGKTYTNAELWAILNAPVAGDASLNLGHQLIAAKLNVLNGTMQSTDGGAIVDADNLLAGYSGKIPLNVGSTTTNGIQMVSIASRLDTFNQDGLAQPGCTNGPTPKLSAACAGSTGQVGVQYNSAIVVSGGFTPYTFALTGGSLPPGLTLNPTTGAITGTPTTAGTFNYNITVMDSSFNSGDGTTVGSITTNCSITIAPAPTATCASITAVQGSAITPVTLAATGGAGAPYTFTATGLPAGLSISSTGTISGTPTVSGTFSYTVTIKDKNGNAGTLNCSVTVSPQVVCAPTTFDMTGGNSASTGSAGNIRTFIAPNGIQVKASAWSRDKSTGAWAPGWLGSYSPGLGVTDGSEDGSDPSHRVDNVGSRVNYVLFEFSAPVVVNRVYLASVGADSDITAWIGTASNPFANHLTLSDSLLAAYNKEANTASNGSDRWADINGTNLSGNVLVVAASATDLGTYDEFKIAKIETSCNSQTVPTPTASCVVINAVQGSAITPITMAGSGGAGGPYTFSATGLPTGLTMASDGTISGTPAVSGTFSYTVTVKDKNGVAGTVTCSLTVTPAPVCAGTTFDFTGSTNAANSGTYGNIRTFTAPNGLQVKVSAWARNKSTGVWSKAFLGQYSPGLGVTDNTEDGTDPSHRVDNSGQVNYVMFEFSAPVKINRVNLSYIGGDSDIAAWIGTQNNPFANHLTLSDSLLTSIGNYEEDLASATSGSRWATLNNGFLQGNVLVIAAKPSESDDYFKIAQLETTCATSITASCVSISAVQGSAITPVTMTAAAGTGAPYTFAASGLPAGLAMSSSGTISGTPTVTGTFSYTVVVTDNTGNTGTVNCSVTVAAKPTATCASITASQGTAITAATVTGSGGAGAPYTFSATGLPAGLTMSSSGTISGTPTVSGTFSYTITVTDKNGNTGTVNCSVTVNPAPLALTCPAITGRVGTAYNSSVTVSGGVGPYTYAIASGALPTGLTLNTSTGAITGTPTVDGPFYFTVKVTDSRGTVALSACTQSCTSGAAAIWDFSAKIGDLGTSEPYTVNGITINAYGYTSSGTAKNLWGQYDGGTEQGLGMKDVSANEISSSYFVQADISAVTAAGGTTGKIWVGSVSGAAFDIYGSNTLGSIGAKLNSSSITTDGSWVTLPSTYTSYKYIAVKPSTGTVLYGKLSFVLGNCNIKINPQPISAGQFTTYTQGGWGTAPSGGNPGTVLKNNWSTVYASGSVSIGGTYKLTFNSQLAVQNFLPQGGTAGRLTANATNPTTSAAGVLAGQLLSAQLSVDFSNKGITPAGLGNLQVVSGALAGKTVNQVLAIANSVIGGGALPSGITIDDLNNTLNSINNNFDNGTSNNGYLER